MYEMTDRQEDLGLLLGLHDVPKSLERALRTVWIPFWSTLPKSLRTPRTLIFNAELLFSLLECLGTTLVSDKIALEREVENFRADSQNQRSVLMRTLSDTAQFAASCQAYNISYSAEDALTSDDLDIPFAPDEPADHESGMDFDNDPMWKVSIVLANSKSRKRLTHIITHEEFVTYFASVAEVVNFDPDPEVLAREFEGILGPSDSIFSATDADDPTEGPRLR